MRSRGMAIVAMLVALLTLPAIASANSEGTVHATVRIFPMVLTLDATPSELNVGDSFELTATLHNLSENNIGQAAATAEFDQALAAVRGSDDKHYGAVTSKRDKSVSWVFTATAPGVLNIAVTASGLDPDFDGTITTEHVIAVTITESGEPTNDPARGPKDSQLQGIVTDRRLGSIVGRVRATVDG